MTVLTFLPSAARRSPADLVANAYTIGWSSGLRWGIAFGVLAGVALAVLVWRLTLADLIAMQGGL